MFNNSKFGNSTFNNSTFGNSTFTNCTVPEDWRLASVTLIFKKRSKSDASNYCPVSLTSVGYKIFKSILRDELIIHLLGNKLLRDGQHGFMPKRPCTTNLLEFLEKGTTGSEVDGGSSMDVIFLDLAKAFEKVPKMRLLVKLEAHGVEETY
jgi:hypothetical protein